MKNERCRYLISQDGAQIYTDESMLILSKAVLGSNYVEKPLAKINMKVPIIEYDKKEMMNYMFWMSVLERHYLDYEYFVEGERFSKYLVPIESVRYQVQKLSSSEISRKRWFDLKIDLVNFFDSLEMYDGVNTKICGDVYEVNISTKKYVQASKLLHDKIWKEFGSNTRAIKGSISVFFGVMNFARRTTSKDGTLNSRVCFSSLETIGGDLGTTRKTVSKYIQELAQANILSYTILKKRKDFKEKYFITDSLSENLLFEYVYYRYRSYDVQDMVRTCTTVGYCEIDNADSCTVDFKSKKMLDAKQELIKLKIIDD